jgi:hypothetical protein
MNQPSNLLSILRWLLSVIGSACLARGYFTSDQWTQYESIIVMMAPLIWSQWHALKTKVFIAELADEIQNLKNQLTVQPPKQNEK